MTILLTGATGYLGSAIVPELIANGSRIIAHTRSADSVAALSKAGRRQSSIRPAGLCVLSELTHRSYARAAGQPGSRQRQPRETDSS